MPSFLLAFILMATAAAAATDWAPQPLTLEGCHPEAGWIQCRLPLQIPPDASSPALLLRALDGAVEVRSAQRLIWSSDLWTLTMVVPLAHDDRILTLRYRSTALPPKVWAGSSEWLAMLSRDLRFASMWRNLLSKFIILLGFGMALTTWLLTHRDTGFALSHAFFLFMLGLLVLLLHLLYAEMAPTRSHLSRLIGDVASGTLYGLGTLRLCQTMAGLRRSVWTTASEFLVVVLGWSRISEFNLLPIFAVSFIYLLIGVRTGQTQFSRSFKYLVLLAMLPGGWQAIALFRGLPQQYYLFAFEGFPVLQLRAISLFLLLMLVASYLRRRFKQSYQDREQQRSDLLAAAEMQAMLLRQSSFELPHISTRQIYIPARQVSGDFVARLPLSQDTMLVVIGDAPGKGLRPALLVSQLLGLIHARPEEPNLLLTRLNDFLLASAPGEFTSLAAASVNSEGHVRFCLAGHLPPFLNGQLLDLPGQLPLGVSRDHTYQVFELTLSPSDRLTFLSDGIFEARNPAGELFGLDRTSQRLKTSAASLLRDVQDWGFNDDISLIELQPKF
jgi:hypothetical protein